MGEEHAVETDCLSFLMMGDAGNMIKLKFTLQKASLASLLFVTEYFIYLA
jgi:hypothetical protein